MEHLYQPFSAHYANKRSHDVCEVILRNSILTIPETAAPIVIQLLPIALCRCINRADTPTPGGTQAYYSRSNQQLQQHPELA